MNQAERYIEEVMRHLLATREERARFEADLRAHFEEALERGEPYLQVVEKLGSPEAVAEAFNAERPLEHAGFWRRLAAFFADMFLFILLAIPIVFIAVLAEADMIPRIASVVMLVLAGLSLFGVSLVYFPLLEARFGRTFGKHIMKIRVVDESGRPIRAGQAIVRRLSYYFDLLVLDSIFIPFTDRKQRALDILAKTIVVKEPGEDAPIWAWMVGLFGWILLAGLIVALVVTIAH